MPTTSALMQRRAKRSSDMGSGAFAIINTATQRKISDIHLKVHPEGFQLDARAQRIFVNLPDESSIDVIDRAQKKQIASWPQSGRSGNYPMALDHERQNVLAVFCNPPVLTILAMEDGAPIAKLSVCPDSDDVFVDAKRHRPMSSAAQASWMSST
jgi:hypothetical protein